MMKPIYALVTLASLLLLWVGSGCLDSTGTDRDAAGAAGADFLLNAEPEAAQSVVDVRTLLEEKKEPTNVVVVGRIDGLGQPTWDPERAAFMLADLSLAPRRRLRRRSTTRRPSTMPRTAHSVARSRRRNWPDWL